MKATTRDKMVAGAMDLIRRRGVNATSVREVVRHTDTPRGSIKHHFPNGKLQLVSEAITLAGQEVSIPLRQLVNNHGVIQGLNIFIDLWRQILENSNFEAGCPVLAVAAEQYIGEDGNPQPDAEQLLLELADAIFKDWQQILEQGLKQQNVESARAKCLANLVIASIEGTVALCRAARSITPLQEVQQEIEILLISIITKPSQ